MDEELVARSALLQSVMVNDSMFRWRLVTSAVHQGSILGLMLLNIFTNDIVSGIRCTLSNTVDDLLN